MTTSTSETNKTTEERSMDTLLSLSYSGMSDEEIERVIEYKAKVKAEQEHHASQLQAMEQRSQAICEQLKTQYEEARQAQQSMMNLALQNLQKSIESEIDPSKDLIVTENKGGEAGGEATE